ILGKLRGRQTCKSKSPQGSASKLPLSLSLSSLSISASQLSANNSRTPPVFILKKVKQIYKYEINRPHY
ncbi:hypothetical protein RRG08_019699, partial [Elysia crispata]